MRYELLSNELRQSDYSKVDEILNVLGPSYEGCAYLHKKGYKEAGTNVIGRWAWVDGIIRPIGPIDFTKVTATQGADVPTVTGNVLDLSDSTFVVDGGYTLRIWNTTDGALVADIPAGSWLRSGPGIAAGAATAAAVAALIAGGKSIRCWVEGLSEFSIGAGDAVELGAGAVSSFVAAGLGTTGFVSIPCGGPWRFGSLSASLALYTVEASSDYAMVGWWVSAAQNAGHGIFHVAGQPKTGRILDGVTTGVGGVDVPAGAERIYTGPYAGPTNALNYRGGGYPAVLASSGGNDIDTAAYADAIPFVASNKALVVACLQCA